MVWCKDFITNKNSLHLVGQEQSSNRMLISQPIRDKGPTEAITTGGQHITLSGDEVPIEANPASAVYSIYCKLVNHS